MKQCYCFFSKNLCPFQLLPGKAHPRIKEKRIIYKINYPRASLTYITQQRNFTGLKTWKILAHHREITWPSNQKLQSPDKTVSFSNKQYILCLRYYCSCLVKK